MVLNVDERSGSLDLPTDNVQRDELNRRSFGRFSVSQLLTATMGAAVLCEWKRRDNLSVAREPALEHWEEVKAALKPTMVAVHLIQMKTALQDAGLHRVVVVEDEEYKRVLAPHLVCLQAEAKRQLSGAPDWYRKGIEPLLHILSYSQLGDMSIEELTGDTEVEKLLHEAVGEIWRQAGERYVTPVSYDQSAQYWELARQIKDIDMLSELSGTALEDLGIPPGAIEDLLNPIAHDALQLALNSQTNTTDRVELLKTSLALYRRISGELNLNDPITEDSGYFDAASNVSQRKDELVDVIRDLSFSAVEMSLEDVRECYSTRSRLNENRIIEALNLINGVEQLCPGVRQECVIAVEAVSFRQYVSGLPVSDTVKQQALAGSPIRAMHNSFHAYLEANPVRSDSISQLSISQ